MAAGDRATKYALAGAALSLGEPIGLLIVRELSGTGPVMVELWQERATYAYVFVTMAIVLSVVGYAVGRTADRLAMLSQTDSLTGLRNRRAFQHQLVQELRRAERYGAPMSLLVADLDGLKQINDQHGHAAGDDAIRSVASAITSTLRTSDLGARWGGDEFAMVLPNTDPAAARHSAERLFARLSIASNGAGRAVTVSVGIATFEPARARSTTAEQLEALADRALYAAKAAGRNQIQVA
jgi:diguanylate cyclase (GGDEF)-like protein